MSTASTSEGQPAVPHALLSQRYRDGVLPPPAQWNQTLETLLDHRSVRHYLPKPLDPGMLEMVIAAAQSASTSSNLQTWSVVAVQDPDRKARLATLANNQMFICGAPVMLIWLADLARMDMVAQDFQLQIEGTRYLEGFMVALMDAGLAAQNALVAAESMGLGGVYVGGIRNKPLEVSAELGLPPNVFPAFGMTLGWPDPAKETGIKPRLPQSVVLHHEQYGLESQRPAIASYNEIARSFQREQGMREIDWTTQCSNRWKDAEALHGRDRMREVLNTLGFGLR